MVNVQRLKSKNIKLTMIIVFVLLFSFSIIYLTNFWYLSNYDPVKKKINDMNYGIENNKKQIFIVGNSRIGVVNFEFLNNTLHQTSNQFNIQVVPMTGAVLEHQLMFLKKIVSMNPDLVLIGVDIEDLQQKEKQGFLIEQNIPTNQKKLLDPKKFFNNNNLLEIFSFDSYYLKNPKLTTLMIIDLFFQKNDKTEETTWDRTKILNHTQMLAIANSNEHRFKGSFRITDNPSILALEKIIDVLSENEIKTVIVFMPRPQEFIDTIPKRDLENYLLFIDKIKTTTPAHVYSLFDDYSNLEIFLDPSHVASTPEGLIYSIDVAEIILKEIET